MSTQELDTLSHVIVAVSVVTVMFIASWDQADAHSWRDYGQWIARPYIEAWEWMKRRMK